MNSKILNIGILLLLTFYWNCERNPIAPNLDKLKVISGQVTLENQKNHGSCFVWVDSLWIGTVTDSSGYFEILIPDSLDGSGIFTLYYHIECFDWAQQKFEMLHGKVVPDHHDVDKTGHFKPVLLEELARITLTTDRTTYSASGDTIRYRIQIENLSDVEIVAIENGLAFYNIRADTVTLYWYYFYPSGPPGVQILSGDFYSKNDFLSLPIRDKFSSSPDLPDGLIPAENYLLTIGASFFNLCGEFNYLRYRKALFFIGLIVEIRLNF